MSNQEASGVRAGPPLRILNLGAGVQSTTCFLLSHEGEIDAIDHAIFADTQEEPEVVYQHLAWLKTVPAIVPIIHTVTIGSLGEHLITGKRADRKRADRKRADGTRFASIPAFTAEHHESRAGHNGCKEGRVARQCTKEYKTELVERCIRYEILGLKPRQRMPKDVQITQIFGISYDERRRAERIEARVNALGWAVAKFPLIEKRWTREDCKAWLKSRVPHETPRSACVFCPFKSPVEWMATRQSPKDWARATEIDRALRSEGTRAAEGMDKSLYVHRKCIPLEMVDVEAEAEKAEAKKAVPLFGLMDFCGDGMCGN